MKEIYQEINEAGISVYTLGEIIIIIIIFFLIFFLFFFINKI